MGEVIKVGMADLNVCKTPDSLTTLGLGSCVGVAIYDKNTKITGLAHIMLPSSKEISNNSNIAKFADTGIEETVRLMKKMGADTSKLVAKIAGGAQMFAFSLKNNDMLNVGERNVNAVKEKLKELNIPIVAEDTGLNYGRTVIIDSNTGMYTIKAVGKPIKEIWGKIMKNRIKYIPVIVMLIAGLVACVVTFINRYKALEAMITILVVLIIFYIIGLIVKVLFNKILVDNKKPEDDTDEAGEAENEQEDVEALPEDSDQTNETPGNF